MARITVIGLGYVGLTTAVCFAEMGHEVVGYDNDPARISNLINKELPIFERGLPELLEKVSQANTLKFTSDSIDACNGTEFAFICVPTPQNEDGSANLSYVLGVVEEIKSALPANSVLITKSTVPVGTGSNLQTIVSEFGIRVASNPEFLREGSAIADFFEPDRIVVGADEANVASRVIDLYQNIDAPALSVSISSAELIKHASNTFLAMKLAFINDVAHLCEKVKADVDEVSKGIGMDSRIGEKFLQAGPGWGGSCFPKDTKALASIAKAHGVEIPLISAAIEANNNAHARVVEQIRAFCGGNLNGKTIAVWGIAFKAQTDDTRSSPAVSIIAALANEGAYVRAFDPVASLPTIDGASQSASLLESVSEADTLAILTEWPEFAQVNPASISKLMKSATVFDARRIINREAWEQHFSKVAVIGS